MLKSSFVDPDPKQPSVPLDSLPTAPPATFMKHSRFRSVPFGGLVLAGFDPQWPVLNDAVAEFEIVPVTTTSI
jgi:hypothetical protein